MRRFAWTIVPLVALCVMGAEEPPPAATYYVSPSGSDSNPGTSAAPWATLQKAAATMRPGDTALIADGEYDGGVVQKRDGAPGAPITFRAVNLGGVVVRGDQTTERDAFSVVEADHVVIEGLTVEAANRAGIAVQRANAVTVRQCRLLNSARWGILAVSCDDLLLEGNESAFSGDTHGISLTGGGDRPILRANRVHDNPISGIQIDAESGQLRPELGTRGDGLVTDALLERNVVYANGSGGGAGINLAGVRGARIVNNLLFNNLAGGIAGSDAGAGLEWGTRDNLILHNTIHFRPGEGRWCISLKNGSTGNVIQNNILSGGRRGALENDDDSPLQSDYNLMSRAGSQQIATNEDAGAFATLEQWREDTGGDMHSLVGQARFVKVGADAEDFHLLSTSPAINSGADRTDVTADLDGMARPQNVRWDMGCYESGF